MVKVETLKEDGSFCVSMWDSGYPLIRGAKISWYSKGGTVPLNLTFINKK